MIEKIETKIKKKNTYFGGKLFIHTIKDKMFHVLLVVQKLPHFIKMYGPVKFRLS